MKVNDKYTRREILEAGSIAMTASVLTPIGQLSKLGEKKSKKITLIHLEGGNDALNTVVPYDDPSYYNLRQELAIKKEELLSLDHKYALHPALKPLLPIFKQGNLAIVLGVGYPNVSMSHTHSTAIWQSGSLDGSLGSKWFSENKIDIEEIKLEGFDTHSNQLELHSLNLSRLASILKSTNETEKDTLVFVYSEFGRSVTPNEEGGTDHGEAGLVFIMGASVAGGIYGDYGQLNAEQDVISSSIDFRDLQAVIKDNWLRTTEIYTNGKKIKPFTA